MPIYVYEIIKDNEMAGERFEIQQSMQEEPLKEHPATGEKVRRVLLPPNLATRYTPGKSKSMLDNRSVEKAGFTKYEKDKLTGTYHRVAGKEGPPSFKKPK